MPVLDAPETFQQSRATLMTVAVMTYQPSTAVPQYPQYR